MVSQKNNVIVLLVKLALIIRNGGLRVAEDTQVHDIAINLQVVTMNVLGQNIIMYTSKRRCQDISEK